MNAKRLGGAAIVLGAVLLTVPRTLDLSAYSNPWDYDEGAYLATAAAVNRGQPLYDPTFCSQPPILPDALGAGFRLAGESVATGRLVVMSFGCVGLGAGAWLAWRLLGPIAAGFATASLAGSYLYARQSWYCDAEMPALAFGLLGLAASVEAAARRSSRWAFAGGLALAAAVMSKVLAVPLIPAAGAALALARPATRWTVRIDRRCGRTVLAAALGFVIGLVGLALPHHAGPMFDQAVRFHLAKTANYQAAGNVSVIGHYLLRDAGTALLAAAGVALGLANSERRVPVLWVVLWAAAGALFLLTHRPLHPHHVILLTGPTALFAGAGAAAVANRLGRLAVVPLVLLALTSVERDGPGLAVGGGWKVTVGPVRNFHRFVDRRPSEDEAAVIRGLQAATGPGELVVTDDPKLAFWAGRGCPPELCDPSTERIGAGYLTFDEAVRATRAARAVVLWRGWLDLVPGYRDWVAAHYRPVLVFDDRRALFVRAEP